MLLQEIVKRISNKNSYKSKQREAVGLYPTIQEQKVSS